MVPAAIRREVERRANQRCEYCGLPAKFAEAPFHMDHIIAEQHRGPTRLENLAFACFPRHAYKGPNISSIDPATGEWVRLFRPRSDRWAEHFEWHDAQIGGRTAIGRATVDLLRMNDETTMALRTLLMEEGVFFPTAT